MKEHHGIKIVPRFAKSRHRKEQNGIYTVPRFARNEQERTNLDINTVPGSSYQCCGSVNNKKWKENWMLPNTLGEQL
jgi:hypothetical protein